MDDKKRVILIKGDKTKWYEQAIFIMRPDAAPNKIPKDFVAEAEKIINNYMNRNNILNTSLPAVSQISASIPQKTNLKSKHNDTVRLNIILNAAMVLCCILLGIILYTFS